MSKEIRVYLLVTAIIAAILVLVSIPMRGLCIVFCWPLGVPRSLDWPLVDTLGPFTPILCVFAVALLSWVCFLRLIKSVKAGVLALLGVFLIYILLGFVLAFADLLTPIRIG
jgi:hypothetical protein